MIQNNISNTEQSLEIRPTATKMIAAGLPGSMAIVRCRNFRCLAILGKDGIWRDPHGGRLDVIEVISEI